MSSLSSSHSIRCRVHSPHSSHPSSGGGTPRPRGGPGAPPAPRGCTPPPRWGRAHPALPSGKDYFWVQDRIGGRCILFFLHTFLKPQHQCCCWVFKVCFGNYDTRRISQSCGCDFLPPPPCGAVCWPMIGIWTRVCCCAPSSTLLLSGSFTRNTVRLLS